MDKIRLVIFFFFITLFGSVYKSFAQTNNEVRKYIGTMEVIFKGKKKPDVQNVIHYLKKEDNGTYELYLKNFKVGKMPGTMSFELENIKRGEAFDRFEKELIEFKFPLLPDDEYDANIKGIISDDKIEYTMKSIGATYMGVSVDVEIHFIGQRQK